MDGVSLLARVRSLSLDGLGRLGTPQGAGLLPGASAQVERSALVACLLSDHLPSDAELVRALTRAEIAERRHLDDGCGETLHACCGLLFALGHLDDVPLVWEAKTMSMDTDGTIPAQLLVPQGASATVRYAAEHGLDDLARAVQKAVPWGDLTVEAGREALGYFDDVPPVTAPAAELADYFLGD